MDFSLLKNLCAIPGISGDESAIQQFVLAYIQENSKSWKVQPQVFYGVEFQDAIVLVFGKPQTAIFAHLDTVGYTVAYKKNLIKVGGPAFTDKTVLVGKDSISDIECILSKNKAGELVYQYHREIERGTCLSYKANFRQNKNYLQTPYLDNRLGVFSALKVAETLSDGIIAFSTYEEVGGGNAEVLGKWIYENYKVNQALISDITWVTSGVQHGKGVAISLRDSGIPRKTYLYKILEVVKTSEVKYQLEVESAGGSDGNSLQRTPYPFNWCFIGAPEDCVHSPNEKVHINDVIEMIKIYQLLMKKL